MTLYVVILLNAAGFAVVWATVSLSYRSMAAARYWFAAMLMTCMSGPLLFEGSRLLTNIGILCTVAGFTLLWMGIHVMEGRRPKWEVLGLLLAGSASGMVLVGGTREADNIIFATSQLVPFFLINIALLRSQRQSVGVSVAVAAGSVMIAGQGGEALTNLLCILGAMSTEEYYSVASWFLICAILGCTVLNLGLLLIVTDRLRAELYSLATRDDLTGLPNRRALRERIELVEKSAMRKGQTVSIMMIDLDRFKQINDRYGHDAGDAALVQIAALSRSFMREGDFLARVGGDEFCALLPDTKKEEAVALADALAGAIEGNPLPLRGHHVTVAASVGVVEWSPDSGSELGDAIPHADSAMFGNKRKGRSSRPVYEQPAGLGEVAP